MSEPKLCPFLCGPGGQSPACLRQSCELWVDAVLGGPTISDDPRDWGKVLVPGHCALRDIGRTR